MFGALLGTLNSFQKQTTGKDSKIARQTEKRAEIDARVKEQLAREKEELEGMKEAADRERRDKAEQAKLKIISERVTPPPLEPVTIPCRISFGSLASAGFRVIGG